MRCIVQRLAVLALGGALTWGSCGPPVEPARPARARVERDRPVPRRALRAADGEPCRKTADCRQGLRCTNQWCRHPSCGWSIGCLKKLTARYRGTSQANEAERWLKLLSKAAYKADCLAMPRRIALLYRREPQVWKTLCGAPPVPGVRKIVGARQSPFKRLDFQVKASGIPREEPAEIHQKHMQHPDLCKAWVDFRLTRTFQGWVIVRFYEQHDCDAARYRARQRDPGLRPKCKTRLYARSDRRYLYAHGKGSRFSLNFYVSTPPEVCRKPNLSTQTYKSGCFCLGLDETRIELEWKEDPFLFHDEVKQPKRPPPDDRVRSVTPRRATPRRQAPRRRGVARPRGSGDLDGLFD